MVIISSKFGVFFLAFKSLPAYPVATLRGWARGVTPLHSPSKLRGSFMIRRNKWVHVKVSGQERDDWNKKANAAGLSLADMIRLKMETSLVGRRSAPAHANKKRFVDPSLLAGLAKVGNNLNQIARWANRYKEVADAVEIIAHLVAFERVLRAFLNEFMTDRRAS